MPRVNFTSGASIMCWFLWAVVLNIDVMIGKPMVYSQLDGLIYNPNVQFNEMERQLNLVFIYGGYYKMGNLESREFMQVQVLAIIQ